MTELAVENEHHFLTAIPTRRWLWFLHSGSEKEFLYSRHSVDVDGTRDVASVIFIVESTVDDVIICDLRIITASQQRVKLFKVD